MINDNLRKKMDQWFYFLIKNASRDSYSEFLTDVVGFEDDGEYEQVKAYIEEKLNIKLFI